MSIFKVKDIRILILYGPSQEQKARQEVHSLLTATGLEPSVTRIIYQENLNSTVGCSNRRDPLCSESDLGDTP
jgi:hypothetical protein